MIQPDLKKKGSFTIVEHEETVRKDEKMKTQEEIERQREKTRRRLEVIAARERAGLLGGKPKKPKTSVAETNVNIGDPIDPSSFKEVD